MATKFTKTSIRWVLAVLTVISIACVPLAVNGVIPAWFGIGLFVLACAMTVVAARVWRREKSSRV